MIDHLRISGLGVIGEATVDLDPGFTVVTGETGAGKTMVVTALGLLLGARADAGAVRRGSSRAVVDAGVRVAADHAALRLAQGFDLVDGIHELSVSLGGGDAPGVGVLLREVSLCLQCSHVIADGGRGDAQLVALQERLRANGFLGGNIVRHDGAQDFLAAGIG